ncbi:hypothetical protein ACMD2_24922 [Ananas comosus]|uniref:Uncharacterized protein n=1 Tax=Ananas comosus TaxID=4615 RepID=A0A199VDF2_ANACO|nr:hypothetical protein ACMD2_24922 [Ananas comosus]
MAKAENKLKEYPVKNWNFEQIEVIKLGFQLKEIGKIRLLSTQIKKKFSEASNLDRIARITLLSSMQNDLLCECEQCPTAYDMWEALKAKFGVISTTRLRSLTMRFDSYKKRADQTMKQHMHLQSFLSIFNIDDDQIELSNSWHNIKL